MASYPSAAPENGKFKQFYPSAMYFFLTQLIGATFTSIIHGSSYPFIRTAKHAGHHVLITGGARGIGRSIALSFARAGASAIAVADISESFQQIASDIATAAKEKGYGVPQVMMTKLDVTDEDSTRQCAKMIEREFKGKLDILVNNAGFMTPALSVSESDADSWWRTMEVNLKGVYLMSKHFVPLLLSTPDGLRTMINVNSVAAHNLRPMASAYGTSKLAVLRFTEFLMVEAGSKGLLAYSVHPGAILTELAKKGMPPETLPGLSDSIDLAGDTVAWLSNERREWLAGRYISSTWDMSEVIDRKAEIVEGDKLKVRLVV
ncbi:oxidoreductase-like protein [Annulohypoxylon maeteangense]|uniref:oxidoreductase-like protein n=1 Tax=Annulohypoxylon maeteangense TaxID=1927788 RepID=UPI0020079733|nr:oxidoreductase-like protein [Annulohypoxylon maeteangense]KAI0880212.1 oxidoreductase-like protein [Annulohypoxylon maeteangense]